MSQLKVNAIRHTGASSDSITLAADGTAAIGECTAKVTNNLSNRNLIINGSMQVAQRATSATTTTSTFVVDRFNTAIVGENEASTTAQITLTSSDTGPWAKGFRNALQITNGNQTGGAGGGDTQQLTYMVEAQDIAQSGWDYTSASSYITLSFWVKSSVAQNFYGYLRSEDGTKQSYPFETGSLSANTWTKVTKTVPGNSNIQIDNNNGPGFLICLYAFEGTDKTGSVSLNTWAAYASSTRTPDNTSTWWTTNDATFAVTGVQLEVGEVATEFEHRTYADELQRCLRYYEILAKREAGSGGVYAYMGMWYSASEFTASIKFQVDKRAIPTFEQVSGTNFYTCYGGSLSDQINSWTGAQAPSRRVTTIYNNNTVSGGTTGHAGWIGLNDDTAVLAVSAEL